MAQGLAVSKPGINVLSYTNLNDLYFHSTYPLLKVHMFGSFSVDSSHGNELVTITHNLGYVPHALVFSQFIDDSNPAQISSQYYQHDWQLLLASGFQVYGYTTCKINTIDIRVAGRTNTSGNALGFYYIFKEQVY